MITLRGGRVPERFHRSPFSVVAALVPLAQQMAKRSRPFTDEALNTQVRCQSHEARRQKSSRAGYSATAKKKLTVDLSRRKDAIRCHKPGESRPGIGRPIACPRSHRESRSHGTRSVRFGRFFGCQSENSRKHRRHLSGRNESQNPTAQASGDRLQTMVKKR